MIILDAGDVLDNKDSLKVVAAENLGLEGKNFTFTPARRFSF